ncbi:Phage integrase, N-terminal SAM-like domain [Giesbergeria anulus]|uniref:Phage integrase, N-terminal SAM-like domain n=1 Tax=Giesbergeria anulus TaxID=180197 RepID=A0A1H9PBN3_9BURK|nr:Phage integrase, N-terminal SAM-like domain [Giesbergeria anulus]
MRHKSSFKYLTKIRRLSYAGQQSDMMASSYPIHRETPTAKRLGKPKFLRMPVSPYIPNTDAPRQPKLLERMRIHLRTQHYSIRTEQAYVDWARRFILFHKKRHPQEMGASEVEAFLSYLAVERQVSASTQNQAKAALLYLYKQVLGVDLPWLDEVVQAKRPQRLPVVLTPSEVRELRLRVKDIEFSQREIVVREGKGNKDRVTVLP